MAFQINCSTQIHGNEGTRVFFWLFLGTIEQLYIRLWPDTQYLVVESIYCSFRSSQLEYYSIHTRPLPTRSINQPDKSTELRELRFLSYKKYKHAGEPNMQHATPTHNKHIDKGLFVRMCQAEPT